MDVLKYIYDNYDPGYDPLTSACAKAGIELHVFDAACDRVYYDGHYGPISYSEWKEQDGREPYSVSKALEILRTVLEQVEDYHAPEEIISAKSIRDALIPWYKSIYGTSIL